MYETTFHLSRRPFVAVPSTDSYFASHSIENARAALVRLIDRYEGPAMVIGPVGTGKSLLSQMLADHYRNKCRVALIPSGRICTRRTLLQVILYELGLSYRGMEEGELRLSLIDHVTSSDFCPNGTLVMVDEADSLPMALLDELRTMTNLMAEGRPCIRLALFGSPRLEEKFAHPRLESFNQRLAGRFYLEPLNRNETLEYIVTQFDECGGDSSLTFSNESLEAIYRATNGVPRMINQLTDHALILATADGKTFVDQELVNAAWSDLQQLPAPTTPSFGPSIGSEHIIEFGELDAVEPTGKTADPDLDPTTVLDKVQRQIAQLQDHEDDHESETKSESVNESEPENDEFESGQESETQETILHLHEAVDPFDDSFECEEVVVTRITPASTVANRNARVVSCGESQEIARKLADCPDLTVVSPSDLRDETDEPNEHVDDDYSPQADVEVANVVVEIELESSDEETPEIEDEDASIMLEFSAVEDDSDSPSHVSDPNTEPSSLHAVDDEFDLASDSAPVDGFHEFIVGSEAEGDSQDLPNALNVEDWTADESPALESNQAGTPQHISQQVILDVEGHEDVLHIDEGIHESNDELPENAVTQADVGKPEEPRLDEQPPAVDLESNPGFVIPELTEADGVIVSIRQFSPFAAENQMNAMSPVEGEAPDAVEVHELRLRDVASADLSDEPPDEPSDEPSDEGVLDADDAEGNVHNVLDVEPTNAEDPTLEVAQTEFGDGSPSLNAGGELELSTSSKIDDDQVTKSTASDESPVDDVAPTNREASNKRFNRLFSKMQSK